MENICLYGQKSKISFNVLIYLKLRTTFEGIDRDFLLIKAVMYEISTFEMACSYSALPLYNQIFFLDLYRGPDVPVYVVSLSESPSSSFQVFLTSSFPSGFAEAAGFEPTTLPSGEASEHVVALVNSATEARFI